MRNIFSFLFIFLPIVIFAQSGNNAEKADTTTQLIFDTSSVEVHRITDSVNNVINPRNLEKRNSLGLNNIIQQQKEQQAKQKKTAMICIGIGLALLLVLIIGLRRSTKKK